MKEENKPNEDAIMMEEVNIRVMDYAQVRDNWVVDLIMEGLNYYARGLQGRETVADRKKIIISLSIMLILLIAYSLAFFSTGNREIRAWTISLEIVVLFLIFVQTKRYFCTC